MTALNCAVVFEDFFPIKSQRRSGTALCWSGYPMQPWSCYHWIKTSLDSAGSWSYYFLTAASCDLCFHFSWTMGSSAASLELTSYYCYSAVGPWVTGICFWTLWNSWASHRHYFGETVAPSKAAPRWCSFCRRRRCRCRSGHCSAQRSCSKREAKNDCFLDLGDGSSLTMNKKAADSRIQWFLVDARCFCSPSEPLAAVSSSAAAIHLDWLQNSC